MARMSRFRWLRLEPGMVALVLLWGTGCGETVLDPIGASLIGGGGGASGAGHGVTITECLLVPNETGWVGPNRNDCGAQGAWYPYNDCNDIPDDCTRDHLPAIEDQVFPPEARGMCTQGTTAVPTNEEEASLKWGAGIALDLNFDDETDNKLPVAGLGFDFVGIRFNLETNIPDIRVNFPMGSTQTTAHSQGQLASGEHTILFADVDQPDWVDEEDRVSLKPGQIISVQFQIPTVIGVSRTFDYCVSNLTLLL